MALHTPSRSTQPAHLNTPRPRIALQPLGRSGCPKGHPDPSKGSLGDAGGLPGASATPSLPHPSVLTELEPSNEARPRRQLFRSHYNLGLCKLSDCLVGQGYQVTQVEGDPGL